MLLTVEYTKNPSEIKGPLCMAPIDGKETKVMADSGSQITILRDSYFFEKWQRKVHLSEPDLTPKAFGEKEIDMLGFFVTDVVILDRKINTKVYVAKKGKNIVGWKDLARLGLYFIPGDYMPIRVKESLICNLDKPP